MSSMPHHPAKPVEYRQKCNGRTCYPNKHVADDRAADAQSQTGTSTSTYKCKQCGMWHIKSAMS